MCSLLTLSGFILTCIGENVNKLVGAVKGLSEDGGDFVRPAIVELFHIIQKFAEHVQIEVQIVLSAITKRLDQLRELSPPEPATQTREQQQERLRRASGYRNRRSAKSGSVFIEDQRNCPTFAAVQSTWSGLEVLDLQRALL
jgi:hypothetical protein